MSLEISTIDSITVINIVRRFDATSAPDIDIEIKALLLKNPERVLFNLSQTEYVASAGLRVLISSTRTIMKSGGKVALCGIQPGLKKVFDMAGFSQIFTIYGTRDEALVQMKK